MCPTVYLAGGVRIGQNLLLQRDQVHDVGYFGPGTFEQSPILDTD